MKGVTLTNLRIFLTSLFTILVLSACGGSNGAATGTLKTTLTDSSTEDYQAIYVSLDHVDVHPATGSWQTVATPGGTYDLLELVNGVREELGISTLPVGHYTQMRLYLSNSQDQGTNLLGDRHPYANYLIDQNNTAYELKVPSGFKSGIKIVQGFDIQENQRTELLLDFDAMKSVVKAGNSGQYLLKPTIKVLNTFELALASGLVSDGSAGLEGAMVSAQTYSNTLGLDIAQQIDLVRGTLTAADDVTTAQNEKGEYQLFLPEGSYNLVAYKSGYQPLCFNRNLATDTPKTQDFTLQAADTGEISGQLNITNAGIDQHATLDFRQAGHCADPTERINVKSLKLTAGVLYSIQLPVGEYRVVASTAGALTQIDTISVTQNANTVHNVVLDVTTP